MTDCIIMSTFIKNEHNEITTALFLKHGSDVNKIFNKWLNFEIELDGEERQELSRLLGMDESAMIAIFLES